MKNLLTKSLMNKVHASPTCRSNKPLTGSSRQWYHLPTHLTDRQKGQQQAQQQQRQRRQDGGSARHPAVSQGAEGCAPDRQRARTPLGDCCGGGWSPHRGPALSARTGAVLSSGRCGGGPRTVPTGSEGGGTAQELQITGLPTDTNKPCQ